MSEHSHDTSESSVELTEDQQEDLDKERDGKVLEVFLKYDVGHEDRITHEDFRHAMEDIGEPISEKQSYKMLAEADPSNTGMIEFLAFKKLVTEKYKSQQGSTKAELLEAFTAMGGEEDGDGCIDAEKLIQVIKYEFGMTIDIEALIEEIDEDGSGEIEFDEFKALLQSSQGAADVDPTEADSEND